MENVISARRLRKSMLNTLGNVNLESYKIERPRIHKERIYDNINTKNNDKLIIKFKTKLIIKLFLSSAILFSLIFSKMFLLENIKSNHNIVRVYNHYIMDFSKSAILNKIEYRMKKIDLVIGNIFPDKIKTYIKEEYFNDLKPYMINFDLKVVFKNLFNLKNSKNELLVESKNVEVISSSSSVINAQSKEEVLNGIGGAEPLEEETKEVTSSISTMQMDIELIKSKGIDIISPVSGVITSKYGAREAVFSNVDPYHTGLDIANKLGTKVISAAQGIVTKVENNNKYYGNFVEVTEKEVIFKYAHLDSISVKLGNKLNQKDIIGLMGSTGMSTGSHLHFEIRVNDRTVNPEEIVKF